MKHRRYLDVATLATIVLLAAGCGATAVAPDPSAGETRADQNRLTLTIVTGESEAEEARALAKAVADVSGGAMAIKIDNATVAVTPDYEKAVIEHVAAGKAQLGFVAARAFDTVGVTSFVGLHAPLLIDSYDLQERVLTSDWGTALLDGTRSAGVVGFGYFQGPMRRPLGITRQLVEASDYRGARIGIRASTLTEITIKALGATPIVFDPGDITGLDGMEVHMGQLVGTNDQQGADSLTGNVLLWPRPGIFFANSQAFDGLTPDQQATLRKAAEQAYKGSVESVASNTPGATDALCQRGLVMVDASETALADLRTAVQPVYDEIEKDAATRATIEAINAVRDTTDAPEAVECTVAVAPSASAPTAGAAAFQGTWRVSFTEAELAASPFLYDEHELNAGNWGDFTLTFDDKGRVTLTQANEIDESSTSGSYTVTGEKVTMAYDEGANFGETFIAQWSIFRDTLTFARAAGDELPTPYVVKAWTRVP